jgi:hypothetical protein
VFLLYGIVWGLGCVCFFGGWYLFLCFIFLFFFWFVFVVVGVCMIRILWGVVVGLWGWWLFNLWEMLGIGWGRGGGVLVLGG